jgi:serine/threonine protein kinase
VDARSDIYALGVIAYEILTHEPPFKGKSVIETMTLRLRTDPSPPHAIRKDCPPELSKVVLKALARDYKERYQTAREMYEDIQELIRDFNGKIKPGAAQPVVLRGNGIRPSVRPSPQDSPRAGASMSTPPVAEMLADASGGMQMSRTATPAARQQAVPTNRIEDDSDTYGMQMESVLSGSRIGLRQFVTTEEGSGIHPAVAVSQSRLSSERLKSLSGDFHPSDISSGWVANVFSAIIIFFLGFGVGWVLLKQFKPELFESRTSLSSNQNLF